jgi:hypothetical protein
MWPLCAGYCENLRPVPLDEYRILILPPPHHNCTLSCITPKAVLFGSCLQACFMTDSGERRMGVRHVISSTLYSNDVRYSLKERWVPFMWKVSEFVSFLRLVINNFMLSPDRFRWTLGDLLWINVGHSEGFFRTTSHRINATKCNYVFSTRSKWN